MIEWNYFKKTGDRKMDASYHRHDINDKVWELLEKYGSCSNHICRGNEASGAGLLRITAVLSMRYFGYCELEHPGVTCLPITGSGAVFIRGSSVGTEKMFGKNSWNILITTATAVSRQS